MKIDAWTNHPISELGDSKNKGAPIREVTIVGYDGGRYARVSVNGITVPINADQLQVRPKRPSKAPAKPSTESRQPAKPLSPGLVVDSAYIRIKNSRPDSPDSIYNRIKNAYADTADSVYDRIQRS
jgi:hypothetical protein